MDNIFLFFFLFFLIIRILKFSFGLFDRLFKFLFLIKVKCYVNI